MTIGAVYCATCGTEKVFETVEDMVGWSWNTVEVNGVSATAWRCPAHPAQKDPDTEIE